jgi:hypothetical protein
MIFNDFAMDFQKSPTKKIRGSNPWAHNERPYKITDTTNFFTSSPWHKGRHGLFGPTHSTFLVGPTL